MEKIEIRERLEEILDKHMDTDYIYGCENCGEIPYDSFYKEGALNELEEFLNTQPQTEEDTPEEGDIRGAIARGYTTKRNENKVLDPDLCEDIATEVKQLLEECEHKYLLEAHVMGLLRIRCPKCGDTRDIEDNSPIRELLNEREDKAREEGIREALEETNRTLGTNVKYINGEYKVVFRKISNLVEDAPEECEHIWKEQGWSEYLITHHSEGIGDETRGKKIGGVLWEYCEKCDERRKPQTEEKIMMDTPFGDVVVDSKVVAVRDIDNNIEIKHTFNFGDTPEQTESDVQEWEWEDDIVALLYGIDKSKSISKTKENSTLLFDYIRELLNEREREGFTEEELCLLLTGLQTYYKKMDEERLDKDTNKSKFDMWTKEMKQIDKLYSKLSKLNNKKK